MTNSHFYIYARHDEGVTWQRQTFGLPKEWNVFMLERTLPDALYSAAADHQILGREAAIYRSVDGRTATKLEINIKYGSWVDIQTRADGAIYMVAQECIHKSGDAGRTWRAQGRDGISW